MTTVQDLIRDRPTFTVEADVSVLKAVEMMVEKNIGAVAVVREGELVGIFSERDLMKRVVAGNRSPGLTKVAEVMTPRPYTVSSNERFQHCMFLMREHGFRHLPVVDDNGKLCGLISLRDVLLRDLTEKDDEVRMMRAYITQQVPGGES
jgi:CBS domain-containing protein